MKKHHQLGNRRGHPAFRTPARFIHRNHIRVQKNKSRYRYLGKCIRNLSYDERKI